MGTSRTMEMSSMNLANSGKLYLGLKCDQTPSETDLFDPQGR